MQVTEAVIAARHSYGRLLALLAARSGDLAGAEDALAEAFAQALETWPENGVPKNPEAWLMTVAKNRQLDVWRSAAERTRVDLTEEAIDQTIEQTIEMTMAPDVDRDAIPDERLKLMFVCAHPAIDAALRAPLMLQTVLGIDAQVIGAAFLVPGSAMAQRLVRVKRKIREAGIPFQTPSQSDMPERLESVLEAVYGAYAIGWSDTQLSGNTDDSLAEESRFLANLLAHLMPDEPEVLGLASYVSLASARRQARFDSEGRFVPLADQDTRLWDAKKIEWGERLLLRARSMKVIGRFQLEAAIESVHTSRLRTGTTDWPSLALLYEGLMRISPNLGAAVARAVAVGHSVSPAQGLAALEAGFANEKDTFQPVWVARAHLHFLARQYDQAVAAIDQAIRLTTDSKLNAHLQLKRASYLATTQVWRRPR
jgi:predicted RNA polymerase sigma factor